MLHVNCVVAAKMERYVGVGVCASDFFVAYFDYAVRHLLARFCAHKRTYFYTYHTYIHMYLYTRLCVYVWHAKHFSKLSCHQMWQQRQ